MSYVIPIKAINLRPGDVCVGPSTDFTERGTVRTTVVIDAGVQICWEGSGDSYTVRPEDHIIHVLKRDDHA